MKKFRILFVILILAFVSSWFYSPQPAYSAPAITIDPLESPVSTSVDYCLGWDSDGLDTSVNSFAIVFDPDFDTSGVDINANASLTEVYVYLDSKTCAGTARPGEPAADDGDDRDHVFYWAGVWIIDLENDEGAIPDLTDISVEFRAVAGNAVVTPATPGGYLVSVGQYIDGTSDPVQTDWSVTSMLYIGGFNKVDISATVDPTLSLTLSSTTCSLGTFSTTNVKTCSYDATVGTNGTNGYSAYIRQEDGLKNAAADEITAVTASEDVTGGGDTAPVDEQYGVGVDTQDTPDVFDNISPAAEVCADYDSQAIDPLPSEPLTTSDQRFASYNAQTDNGTTHGKTTLCHGASILATTPAGVYSQIVTLTVVGNF